MNKVCRTVWNGALSAFVAVSEKDKAMRSGRFASAKGSMKRGPHGMASDVRREPGIAGSIQLPLDTHTQENNRRREHEHFAMGNKRSHFVIGLATFIGLGASSPLAYAQFVQDGGTANGADSIAIGLGSQTVDPGSTN